VANELLEQVSEFTHLGAVIIENKLWKRHTTENQQSSGSCRQSWKVVEEQKYITDHKNEIIRNISGSSFYVWRGMLDNKGGR
jgi:hypothetical protein